MSFSYSDLEAKLPAGTLTETTDDVTISLKALTGATSVQLADTSLADAVHDFLAACAAAQTDYNAANPSNTINSFGSPIFGAPTLRSDGQYKSNSTFSVVTTTPLNLGQTEANS